MLQKLARRLVRELFFGSWQGMDLFAGAVGFIIVASISDALGFHLPHFCFLFCILNFFAVFPFYSKSETEKQQLIQVKYISSMKLKYNLASQISNE